MRVLVPSEAYPIFTKKPPEAPLSAREVVKRAEAGLYTMSKRSRQTSKTTTPVLPTSSCICLLYLTTF